MIGLDKFIKKRDSKIGLPPGTLFTSEKKRRIQIMDAVETYTDLLSGMHDTYLSSISNRMNEIIKVLTNIATIFILLTFIAGIYGMNFEFMPELKWHGGYFAVWGIIMRVAVIMVMFFKRKRWL